MRNRALDGWLDAAGSTIQEARRVAGALRRGLASGSRYASESYSQEGEDLILRRAFEDRQRGFYVDVGAHHPMRFSNTYVFYRAGWRGINIDATPGSMEPFRKKRPRDINVEIAISERRETLTYHTFDEPALNTFSAELARSRQTESGFALNATVEIKAEPLVDVLVRYVPAGQHIDFLTVDVEGWDLRVLKSNDWDRFRPDIVVAEAIDQDLETITGNDVVSFLRANGYRLFAKTVNSVLLRSSHGLRNKVAQQSI